MITDLIKQLNDIQRAHDETEAVQKERRAAIKALELEIVETSRNQMVDSIEMDGFRYYPKMETKYHIPETKSDHSKKCDLFDRLEEIGYGDDIKRFQSGFIHATRFRKIMEDLSVDTINALKADGLLTVFEEPTISRYKVSAKK